MREIKFRAKREHWKEFDGWDKWLYANGYYFDGTNYWFVIPDPANSAFAWVKKAIIDIETLGEYTGIKDKNGVEVYEGDIIKGIYNRYPQNWQVNELSAYGVTFTRLTTKPLSPPYWYRDMRHTDQWEVIDNIWEHSRLKEGN